MRAFENPGLERRDLGFKEFLLLGVRIRIGSMAGDRESGERPLRQQVLGVMIRIREELQIESGGDDDPTDPQDDATQRRRIASFRDGAGFHDLFFD
jgi:hypothetical protein